MHRPDIDPCGVISAGDADKYKNHANPVSYHNIDGCMALVFDEGGGVSKDLSKFVHASVQKASWAPHQRSMTTEKDAAFLQEHKIHAADEVRRTRGAPQTVRIRGKVNLLNLSLRAPQGGRQQAVRVKTCASMIEVRGFRTRGEFISVQ